MGGWEVRRLDDAFSEQIGEDIKKIRGSVTTVRGFTAAGVRCGMKTSGKRDLALIYSKVPASAAGLFTTSKLKGAPVIVSQENIIGGLAQAIVINSGYANACTGEKGIEDARRMVELVAEELNVLPEMVLVASTGLIGQRLPMDKIERGIVSAVNSLKSGGGDIAAEAIMTTDNKTKGIALETTIDGAIVRIGGIAKGTVMVNPDLATMLAFITTDVAISSVALNNALKRAVDKSFSRITIDGDRSPNDMVIVLANGLAENNTIEGQGEGLGRFQRLLDYVCVDLARKIVQDGAGATKFIEINVSGARSEEEAKKVAYAVANSPLVKTALFGQNSNWGRIVAVVGYLGIDLDLGKIKVGIGDEIVFENGDRANYSEKKLNVILSQRKVKIDIDLGIGERRTTVWTCDLSYDYVRINREYQV